MEYFNMLLILSFLAATIIYWDTHRFKTSKSGRFVQGFNSYFMLNRLLKPHEQNKKLTGATFMLISAILCVMIFPKEICIIAFSILIICDPIATFVGILFGKKSKTSGKSIVGTEAFAICSVSISLIFGCHYELDWAPLIIAAIASTYFEHVSNIVQIDDNFLIPVSYCLAFVIFSALL